MDVATRYSSGAVVEFTGMEAVIYELNLCWLAQFWPLATSRGHTDSTSTVFVDFIKSHDIELRPVPSRTHEKNTNNARHSTIRSIFLHLKSFYPSVSDAIQVTRAAWILND